MRSAVAFALGYLAALASIVAIGALAHSQAQFSVSVFGLSKHSQPGYCEINPGLAINYQLSPDWRLMAGQYKNSKCKQTEVEAIVYCGLRWGNLCAGAGFARLTGYSDRALYVPLPTVSYERPKYAIDFVGGAYQGKAVIGMGIRFPL